MAAIIHQKPDPASIMGFLSASVRMGRAAASIDRPGVFSESGSAGSAGVAGQRGRSSGSREIVRSCGSGCGRAAARTAVGECEAAPKRGQND
ncbi:hypothetical protein GCM10009594_02330 [Kocuria palustris]